MASQKNHRPMSQPERAFWRDICVARSTFDPLDVPTDVAVRAVADYADKLIDEYRKRVTWRQPQ